MPETSHAYAKNMYISPFISWPNPVKIKQKMLLPPPLPPNQIVSIPYLLQAQPAIALLLLACYCGSTTMCRIYHRPPIQTEKSQPEGKHIMWKRGMLMQIILAKLTLNVTENCPKNHLFISWQNPVIVKKYPQNKKQFSSLTCCKHSRLLPYSHWPVIAVL